MDIISKCTGNSTFDPNCRVMIHALQIQLASQHKNRLYKFHIHYKKFSTKEEVEVCLKKLGRIPGHLKGHSVSTKQIMETQNLRTELELEKEKSRALEIEVQEMKTKQTKFQEDQEKKTRFMMKEILRLSKL